jgi:hypothetical protein
MQQPDPLDDLDRALSRAAERVQAAPTLTLRRPRSWSSRLRRTWDRHRSWILAALYGAGALWLAASGEPRKLIVFVLVLGPSWWADYREQRQQVEQLGRDEDFLRAERERIERRHSREVTALTLMLGFAALLGLAALTGKHPREAGAACGIMLAVALARWALFMPGLRRELHDVGGDPRGGRFVGRLFGILALIYALLLPFILAFHFVRDALRRMRGLPPLEEHDADDDEGEDADENGGRP